MSRVKEKGKEEEKEKSILRTWKKPVLDIVFSPY
jgi:hypothetical protein